MFQEFCMALVLECFYIKHGRQLTLDACMTSFIDDMISQAVALASVPSGERVH